MRVLRRRIEVSYAAGKSSTEGRTSRQLWSSPISESPSVDATPASDGQIRESVAVTALFQDYFCSVVGFSQGNLASSMSLCRKTSPTTATIISSVAFVLSVY